MASFSNRVADIMEELHEEIDSESQNLSQFQVGTVIRAAAERAVEEANEERVRLIAYLRYHCGDNPRLEIALEQCEIGAHRRNRSQSIEAVAESSGRMKV